LQCNRDYKQLNFLPTQSTLLLENANWTDVAFFNTLHFYQKLLTETTQQSRYQLQISNSMDSYPFQLQPPKLLSREINQGSYSESCFQIKVVLNGQVLMLPSLFQESDSLRSIKNEIPQKETILHTNFFPFSAFCQKKKLGQYTLLLIHLQPKKSVHTHE